MTAGLNPLWSSSGEQQLLRAKQEMIAEVIAEAQENLRTENTESYFRTMEKILKAYALAEDGDDLFLRPGFNQNCRLILRKKLRRPAEAKGGSLVLKKEPKAIEDGFILVYGGIEENCTLKALFDAKKDELQDKVNEILFL